MNQSIPVAFVAAFTVACADGTLPPRAADDPSNRNAAEAPTLLDALDAASPPPGPADVDGGGASMPPGHEHHHHPMPSPSSSGGTP
jgi:hypothetical protein